MTLWNLECTFLCGTKHQEQVAPRAQTPQVRAGSFVLTKIWGHHKKSIDDICKACPLGTDEAAMPLAIDSMKGKALLQMTLSKLLLTHSDGKLQPNRVK